MEDSKADKIIFDLKKVIAEVEKKNIKKNNLDIRNTNYSIKKESLIAIDELLKKIISFLEERKNLK